MKKLSINQNKFGHVVHCDALQLRSGLNWDMVLRDVMVWPTCFFFEIIFFENGCGRAYK